MAAPAADPPTLTKMCLWIGVSKSGFYDWKDRPLSVDRRTTGIPEGKTEKIFDDNDETYGCKLSFPAGILNFESSCAVCDG